MLTRYSTMKTRLADRRGFALAAVLFSMVIMSIISVVALSTSVDEQRSSQAVRRSAEAFYAAQSGLGAILADWNDTSATATLDSVVRALESGGTLKLSPVTLGGGASYAAQITRVNEAGQPIFLLSVEGRDASGNGGERELSIFVTGAPGKLTLGGCCDAAAQIQGEVKVKQETAIHGTDTDPTLWADGRCDSYEQNDQAGLTVDEEGLDELDIGSGGYVESGDSITYDEGQLATPAVVVDTAMADSSFNQYGSKTWQEIKDMATTTIGNGPGNQLVLDWGGDPATDDTKFGPRYHTVGDGHGHVAGDAILGSCDTTHPLNFGAPSGPCKDHFPIILVQGEVEIKDVPYNSTPLDKSSWEEWYMQGVIILDTLSNGMGSEFELESPGTLAAIIIGNACLQLQDGSQTYGAVFVNGNIGNEDTCENPPLQMDKGDHPDYEHTDLFYSECVVQEILSATGIGEESEEGKGGVVRLASRSFAERLR